MRFYQITLLLLPMLLLTVACSVDTVEDSDAGILDPTPTDFRFQNLPIIDGAGGSLIPLDEIPVITIEKTREDDDFFYWQLRADPAPIHEDLVVGVNLPNDGTSTTDEIEQLGGLFISEEQSFFNLGLPSIWIGEAYFSARIFFSVVIPRFQNTSQELKIPQELRQPLEFALDFFDINEVRQRQEVEVHPTLIISSFFHTARIIDVSNLGNNNEAVRITRMEMPIFQTSDGYILREGFAFSYYLLGESSSLALGPPPPLE